MSSFDQEWAGLVAGAASRGSTSMNLNDAGPANGGRYGTGLNVSVSVLRSYAGKSDTARGDFAKADNDTMRETEQVPGTMTGFESDEAVQELQKRWRGQMRYLDGLLGGVSKGLREAAKNFTAEDVRRKEEMDKLLPPEYGPYVPGTEPPPQNGLTHPGSAPLLDNPFIPGIQKPLYDPFAPGIATTEPKS